MKRLPFYILLFISIACGAQQLPLRFEHIDEKDGLSNNIVNRIFCDSQGYMWFGTYDGLNKYDGSVFNIFRHSNIDTASLAGNDINAIAEDGAGHLWIGEHCSGLSNLNPFNKKSINYYATENITGLRSACDLDIVFDAQKNIWVCNRTALSMLNKDGRSFRHFYPFDATANNLIYRIAISKNTIWLSHAHGLKSFDISTGKFTGFEKLADSSTCGKIVITKEGYVLVTTWLNGLYIIDPLSKKTIHVLKGITATDVAIVNLAGRQQLWVTSTTGLYTAGIDKDIFSVNNNSFHLYMHDDADATSLSSNNILCIYYDSLKNKCVWLGTDKGIDKLDPLYLQFTSHDITKDGKAFTTTTLYSILKERDNNGNAVYWQAYWHGTGLLQTDSLFHVKKQLVIKDEGGNPAIVSNAVRGKDGNLWLATWDGLWCYDDKKDKLIKAFRKEGPDKMHLSSNSLDYVLQDSKGRFWAGTYGRGLNLINLKDSTVKIFKADGSNNALADNRTDFIYEDRKGRIWIAGPVLQLYNEAANNFKTYSTKRADTTSLPGYVNSIYEDSGGKLWAATDGGFAWLDENTGLFHTYTSAQGLPGNYCQAITEDDHGNLWVTTSGGLCSINTKNYLIKSYTTNDGLPTNQLGNVICKSFNGQIFFSLDNGNSPFISFDPAKLTGNKTSVPFHFLSVNVLGAEQFFEKPADDIKTLNLSWKQNVFTISFKALDYRNAGNIRYQCMLQGFDKTWADPGHRNNVTYTNLDGGTYTLKVKATDASGEWLDKELQLVIEIQPPFWKTWWFYLVCVAVIALTVYIVFTQRIKHIRKEEQQKRMTDNEMAELKMKALKAQMNPHFVFNSLSSIQESILDGKTDAAAKYLGKFSKLIRMVLDFSDTKLITLQQEKEYLCLYLELESFRFDDLTFDVHTSESIDAEYIKIPPMLIQPFVENAVKHGLSHKRGSKYVSVSFNETADGYLQVIISDNGIGREEAAIINAGRKYSHQSVGMKITGSRLQMMQEKNASLLAVTDKKDENGNAAGTEVTILIPLETTV